MMMDDMIGHAINDYSQRKSRHCNDIFWLHLCDEGDIQNIAHDQSEWTLQAIRVDA